MAKRAKGAGRPKKAGVEAPAVQLGLRCSKGFLARLDRWRKDQDTHPARAEAIRQLTETALDKDGY